MAVTVRPPIDLANYLVLESSDLGHANSDGAVTVDPGDDVVLCEYEPTSTDASVLLHALGATNLNGIQYQLEYGQNVSHRSEGPPGGYNDPFSFTQNFGAPLTSDQTVTYRAINISDTQKDLVAVMHVEIDETPGPVRSLQQQVQQAGGGN